MEIRSRRTQGGRAAAAIAAGVAVASCIRAGAPAPVESSRTGSAASVVPLAGDYACSLQAGAHRYPAFRCHIYRAEDGSLVLEKVGGSQRFRGRLTPAAGGFAFDGTFFCPSGDCTESVTAEFAAVGAGRAAYRGVMRGRSGPLGVSLDHLPGGFTYGGATATAAGAGVTGPALSR
jgi:hypothetical protein